MSTLPRDPQVSADRQPNCCHAQLCAWPVDFSVLAGVAATASADLEHHARDAQEGFKSQNEGAHQVQPTIVRSILPLRLTLSPQIREGGFRTAVWASFPPDGVIHKTTLRANTTTSSKSRASGSTTFVLSFLDVEACVAAT